jgi:hypothetical protein
MTALGPTPQKEPGGLANALCDSLDEQQERTLTVLFLTDASAARELISRPGIPPSRLQRGSGRELFVRNSRSAELGPVVAGPRLRLIDYAGRDVAYTAIAAWATTRAGRSSRAGRGIAAQPGERQGAGGRERRPHKLGDGPSAGRG